MLSKDLKEIKKKLGKLPDAAANFGYTVVYTTDFGNVVCDECAKVLEHDEYETLDGHTSYSSGPDIECDECGDMIKSDYGELGCH